MAKLQCDICGGQIEMQSGGEKGICANCGTAYTVERMRELYSGIKVSITGTKEDVEQWKALLDTYIKACDFSAAEQIVKKILEASPSDSCAQIMYDKLQDWKFMEVKNGVLQKYTGENSHVIIPEGVKSIGDRAFFIHTNINRTTLKSVTIPNSVSSIGDGAFCNCTSLGNFEIPNSVSSIGRGAFQNCTSLTDISIPGGVTNIGINAFRNCSSLVNVTISFGVTIIDSYAFCGCTSLKNITIPGTVTQIGRDAFMDCKSLTSLTIPNSVTSIGREVFYGCSSLAQLLVSDNLTVIQGDLFSDCGNLMEIQYPPSLSSEWFKGTGWYGRQLRKSRRDKGICQYCGGEFKGFRTKTCTKCGKVKDY